MSAIIICITIAFVVGFAAGAVAVYLWHPRRVRVWQDGKLIGTLESIRSDKKAVVRINMYGGGGGGGSIKDAERKAYGCSGYDGSTKAKEQGK